MKPNPAQKNVELEVKAGDREFRVREEFPKTNIRRWTTPGSRFEIPANLSSQEARLTAIKIQKQLMATRLRTHQRKKRMVDMNNRERRKRKRMS